MARKIRLKLGTPYFIEWIDAYSGPNSWQTEEEVEEMFTDDYVCWTLGWLQKVTERYYIFSSTTVPQRGSKGSVWAIPKKMIIRVEEVGY